jgi:HemY protein
MKKLIFYFIVLLASVWVGLKIAADPGYLLIDYQKVTVEMPLWLTLIFLILFFTVFYFILRTISNVRSLRSRFLSWSRSRRVRRAWQRTHRGFIALLAGDWKLAEKDLVRAAPSMDHPILNYLAAAYCAQAQQAISTRDEYLGKIVPKNKLTELALGLSQAQLQLQQHQYEQALAKLQQLQQTSPKHKMILKLLKKTYLKLADWGSLEILLPQLEKQNILTEAQLEKLSAKVYSGLLKNTTQLNDASLIWSRIPKSLRYSPELLLIYIPMLSIKNPDEAENIVRASLDKNLHSSLLTLYGQLDTSQNDKQLHYIEKFLKTHPDNPVLLLTLARLCVKNELWGKALSYFQASIGLSPNIQSYLEQGQLLEKLGETQKATESYKQGIIITCNRLNSL